MSSSCVCWLLLLLLLFLLPVLFSPCWANSITLSLTTQSHHYSQNSNRLRLMAYATIQRARHLKKCTSASTPLFPVDSGYSTTLEFGTPPQRLGFIMDTGSSLVWFPCELKYKYTCTDCGTTSIPTFKPKLSSSSRNVSCSTRQLKRIIPNNLFCTSCWNHPTPKCSKLSVDYIEGYGTGNTTGEYLLESLTLSGNSTFPNLLVGCSVSSYKMQRDGIAGFGRGRESLPAQLDLKSFSYCLVSHQYDDSSIKSDLVLNWGLGGEGDGGHVNVINHTPFAQNPNVSSYPEFLEYYYVNLLEIHVGSVKVNIPNKHLMPNTNGYGGTVVDTGTPCTVMEKVLFDPVAQELHKQLGKRYTRSKAGEESTGLELCYNVPRKANIHDIPALTFILAGSVKMVMPFENSFVYYSESVVCTTMMSYDFAIGQSSLGPAIIFGNYMQQNFHMEFDLQNNQLGFYPTNCVRG